MPCGISASKPAVTGSVTVSPEDIKRVKGMGFLHGQGHDGLLQRPGHHPQRQGHRAKRCGPSPKRPSKFGNGEVAMTTRLTVEIQSCAL